VTLLAISVDPLERSRTLAAELGIRFPLLRDEGQHAARAFTGVDDQGFAVPGVVVLRPSGEIAFIQRGEDKADRLGAAALLEVLDATFGKPAGAPAAARGYTTPERLQLGLALGGGALEHDDASGPRAVVRATALGLYPLARHLLVGAMVDGEARSGWLAVDGAAVLRLPITGDQGAIGLGLRAGRTVGALSGWHAAVRPSLSFALRPNWALELALDLGVHRLGADHPDGLALEASATLGITRLLRVR
jgi:hypothetical protein